MPRGIRSGLFPHLPAALRQQQTERKSTANCHAEIRLTLAAIKQHMQSGEVMNTDDALIMRSMVERIVVYDEWMEIRFKCGVEAGHQYV